MYRLQAPAEPLKPYIENYWFVSHGSGEEVTLRVDVFVDARADLIFNFGVPYRREVIGAAAQLISHSNLDAQRLVPIRISQHGSIRIVGVRFRLGGLAPFTRTQLNRWSGQTPAPAEVFGETIRQLEAVLRDEPDADASAAALDRFFLEALSADGDTRAAFERMLLLLVGSDGRASVSDLAAATACTPRQVQRQFARALGFPPTTVGRVLRFQRALRALMVDPGIPLVEIAGDAGYFDQAHFVRDFRVFTGGVPRGYRGYYPPDGPDDFAPNVVAYVQDVDWPRA